MDKNIVARQLLKWAKQVEAKPVGFVNQESKRLSDKIEEGLERETFEVQVSLDNVSGLLPLLKKIEKNENTPFRYFLMENESINESLEMLKKELDKYSDMISKLQRG